MIEFGRLKLSLVFLLCLPVAAFGQQFSVPVTVSDGSNSEVLHLGVHPSGSATFDTGLDTLAPPAPPPGAFDARLDGLGDEYVADIRDNSLSEKTYVLRYAPESGRGPITLSWDNAALTGLGDFMVTDNIDGQQFLLDMKTAGSLDVSTDASLSGSLRILVTPADPSTSIEDPFDSPELPETILLHQNYPNPFNPATTISYKLPQQARVKIAVYNSLGARIALLLDEDRSAGRHSISFNAEDLATGIYFYQIQAAGVRLVKRMTLTK